MRAKAPSAPATTSRSRSTCAAQTTTACPSRPPCPCASRCRAPQAAARGCTCRQWARGATPPPPRPSRAPSGR
eukprot:1665600-Prymnesium_polylepis.1